MTTQSVTQPDRDPAPPSALVARHVLPRAAARVKLADRVARAFPPLACVRGYRYFHGNGVTMTTLDDSSCEADVKGQRTQTVLLRVEEGRLGAACTCAANTLGPAACKHVWATLLELDRRDAFVSLRGSLRPLALTGIDAAPKRKIATPQIVPSPETAPVPAPKKKTAVKMAAPPKNPAPKAAPPKAAPPKAKKRK